MASRQLPEGFFALRRLLFAIAAVGLLLESAASFFVQTVDATSISTQALESAIRAFEAAAATADSSPIVRGGHTTMVSVSTREESGDATAKANHFIEVFAARKMYTRINVHYKSDNNNSKETKQMSADELATAGRLMRASDGATEAAKHYPAVIYLTATRKRGVVAIVAKALHETLTTKPKHTGMRRFEFHVFKLRHLFAPIGADALASAIRALRAATTVGEVDLADEYIFDAEMRRVSTRESVGDGDKSKIITNHFAAVVFVTLELATKVSAAWLETATKERKLLGERELAQLVPGAAVVGGELPPAVLYVSAAGEKLIDKALHTELIVNADGYPASDALVAALGRERHEELKRELADQEAQWSLVT